MDQNDADIIREIVQIKTEKSMFTLEYETNKETLELEIEEIDLAMEDVEKKQEELIEKLASQKSEYNRSEAQIVALQYSIETMRKSLKSYENRRTELENLNDHWERSIRSLEYYNNTLEKQLDDAENQVMNLTKKISTISERTEDEYKKIKAECEEIKVVIMKSRSPSPSSKPPRSPIPMNMVKEHQISIEQKVVLEEKTKVIIVASPQMYASENTVIFKEKNMKKEFEFNKVVLIENMSIEMEEALDQVTQGGSACLINLSVKDRENTLLLIVKKIISTFFGKKCIMNCIEMIKETAVNKLPSENMEVYLGPDTLKLVQGVFQHISKGKNHLLITFQQGASILQILDLGEVNEDQSLAESLSINSSMFYLEELMMNISKKKNTNFNKALITQRLEPSLKSNYYILFLIHCENALSLPSLTFAARLQAIFLRISYSNEEIHRTLNLLEKERISNFNVLRLIEKARKDLGLYKKSSEEKDKIIEILNKKIKNSKFSPERIERISSLSPTNLKEIGHSRIPKPFRK
ncbi:hypothetical protein SteCoe_23085 [Stentor coeruleus]|uniref:Uncharacterized protein n=1 Tax=Stentor coeruleus TaxID=5963 RepID=A0A1R2BKQ1_9CILI|nr:hypothetical protein SteCoe_23085 [Stentor coeruleus]